jgi:hypothetical protein
VGLKQKQHKNHPKHIKSNYLVQDHNQKGGKNLH